MSNAHQLKHIIFHRNQIALTTYHLSLLIIISANIIASAAGVATTSWIVTAVAATTIFSCAAAGMQVLNNLYDMYAHTPAWQLAKWRCATAAMALITLMFTTAAVANAVGHAHPLGPVAHDALFYTSMYLGLPAILFPATAAIRSMIMTKPSSRENAC